MSTVKYYDWSYHQARTRPNKVAVKEVSTGRETTYGQLEERSCRLASWLQNKGVKKGDRVAILIHNCTEVFELEFACAKIGAIELPLNWRLTKPELEYILNDSSPEVLIYGSNFADTAKALTTDCSIKNSLEIDDEDQNNEYEQALKENIDFDVIETTHDDLIMLMYTSGTTGHPKGAMITHEMQFYNIVNLAGSARVTDKTVQLIVLPLFHTGGMNCYANPILHYGGQIVLMKEFDPGKALEIIDDPDYGITHFFAVPAPFQFMMQHPNFDTTDFSRIEGAGVGGAPCAEIILKSWQSKGVELWQGWGMTETSPGGIGLAGEDAARKVGSAGKPLLHTEVKIVNEDGNEVDQGEVGRGVANGERYAGQTASGADVEQTCLGHEAKELCGDETMGKVLDLYAFGVLAGYEIYLGVPFSEKLGVGGQSFPRFLGYLGKPPRQGGPWVLFRVHQIGQGLGLTERN